MTGWGLGLHSQTPGAEEGSVPMHQMWATQRRGLPVAFWVPAEEDLGGQWTPNEGSLGGVDFGSLGSEEEGESAE